MPLILRPLCSYSGVNANFKKIGRGDEITILVVGRRGVGKTTFLDNLTLSVEADQRHKMVELADRLAWSQQQTQSRELAHMTSVVLMGEGTTHRMVDVIDADCEDKITDGVYDCTTSGAFVNAGDAAVLLYSTMDASSHRHGYSTPTCQATDPFRSCGEQIRAPDRVERLDGPNDRSEDEREAFRDQPQPVTQLHCHRDRPAPGGPCFSVAYLLIFSHFYCAIANSSPHSPISYR